MTRRTRPGAAVGPLAPKTRNVKDSGAAAVTMCALLRPLTLLALAAGAARSLNVEGVCLAHGYHKKTKAPSGSERNAPVKIRVSQNLQRTQMLHGRYWPPSRPDRNHCPKKGSARAYLLSAASRRTIKSPESISDVSASALDPPLFSVETPRLYGPIPNATAVKMSLAGAAKRAHVPLNSSAS